MTAKQSRFSSLAQAVKERMTDAATDEPSSLQPRLAGGSVHKPAAALGAMGETLRDHIARLEAELARTTSANAELLAETQRARALRDKAGEALDEFIFVAADRIVDRLPRDRFRGRDEGREFEDLLADIKSNGQNDAITVRRTSDGPFEVAAGRRRVEVCRRLNRPVLARVRDLDDQAMLRIQFSENERRSDISALERARWFAEVKERMQTPAKEIAAQFGVDPSTFSLYLRLSRFPDEILDRLDEPRRLAVLPARRVMEAIESDPGAMQRILDALDAYRRLFIGTNSAADPTAQIDILIRAAEGRTAIRVGLRSAVPDRRHVVHQGRRIGTLTRNGGQWVFRFATSIPDAEVHKLTDRLAIPLDSTEAMPHAPSNGPQSGFDH